MLVPERLFLLVVDFFRRCPEDPLDEELRLLLRRPDEEETLFLHLWRPEEAEEELLLLCRPEEDETLFLVFLADVEDLRFLLDADEVELFRFFLLEPDRMPRNFQPRKTRFPLSSRPAGAPGNAADGSSSSSGRGRAPT